MRGFFRCRMQHHKSARDFGWIVQNWTSALPWHPGSPAPLSDAQTEGAHSPDAEVAVTSQNTMKVLFLEMSPCMAFHILSFHPKLTWADGDSGGCGPSLLGSLYGKCLKSGQESLPERLRGAGCWPGLRSCKSDCLWRTGLGKELLQRRAIFSVAQDSCDRQLNRPACVPVFPRTHFFAMKKHQPSRAENFLQRQTFS